MVPEGKRMTLGIAAEASFRDVVGVHDEAVDAAHGIVWRACGRSSHRVNPAICNRVTVSALTAMTSTAEEKAFLRVAVAAIPRVAEMIQGFPPDDQAGALETAERCFMKAALDHGCTEVTAQSRVSEVTRRLRGPLERQRASEKKLQALLHRLAEQD
jgi:hypothetical protein